jgi:hypothetical protein
MTAAEVLANHGIQRATEVIELAGAAELELPVAVTLLEKESGGGHNVWGHDNVDTGGHYIKGDVVTKEAYLNYKRDRKRLGAQGVGPTQLTFPGFQDTADDRGGCFDWRINCLVGFEILAGHIRAKGVHDGFRAYNGSGAAAERYADDAISRLAVWRSRLSGALEMALFPQEEADMTKDELLDALESDRGQKALRSAVIHVLRQATGPDDATQPASKWFESVRADIKDIKRSVG